MRALVPAILISLAPLTFVSAQSAATSPAQHPTADSGEHRPPPMVYFARSALIPGWGQASLDRKLTAGLFIAFEGLAVSMAMKTGPELRFLDHADSATATARRAERQDWIALIIFNHLFSALEAYVSAHMIDFPPDLKARPLPGGRVGFGVTIGLPHH